MYEIVKVVVDTVANHHIFGMVILYSAAFVVWEDAFEASGAITVVFRTSTLRIDPIDTVWTSFSSAMPKAVVCGTSSTVGTAWFDTSNPSTVPKAVVCGKPSTF
jgi:hypothetical protein